MSERHGSIARVAAGAVVALVLAGCAAASNDAVAPVATTVDVSILGASNPATGTPVTIGFVTDGKTPAVDNTPEVEGAKAAAAYINEHLGGIKGHPLEIEVCETSMTPAGTANCGSKMIDEGVPIVLGGTPGVVAPLVTGLEAAGVPYFASTVADQTAILSPDVSLLANVLGFIAAPALLAQKAGYTRTVTVIVDVPAAVGPVKALAQPLYDKAGITHDFVPVPVGTPDMTPQVQAALNTDPQMFTVIGDPPFCTAALNALSTLGFTGTKFINSQCYNEQLASTVNGGLEGVKVGATKSLDPDDTEVALYLAAMAKYGAPGIPPLEKNAPDGFAVTLAFARAMNAGLQGDITPASVKAALVSAPPQPVPLMAGQTFQCNRKAYKLTPAICSTGMSIITLDVDGKPVATEMADTGTYFEPGS